MRFPPWYSRTVPTRCALGTVFFQLLQQSRGVGGVHRQEKPAGGLRVVQQVLLPKGRLSRASPRTTASEKQTVRRMAVGHSVSVITTRSCARQSRRAIPVAMSPAPRMTTSI